MKRLAILGASGHGKVLAGIAELQGWEKIEFFDDAWPAKAMNGPWLIVGDTEFLKDKLTEYQGVIVAIGHNSIRLEKQLQLEQLNANLVTLIHPAAVVSHYAQVMSGSVVMANAVINPFASLGKACIVNTAATVDHDCILADGVHISPGANVAGGVTIGTKSWVGVGAAVKQMLHIGHNVVIGAGASVVNNLESNKTFVGIPAKEKQ
ncbi:acetyltransferase [Photobacterium minamisatsumaniensis]|uniref:acetyltransferase n=1 Tax=Photobacterium minamisatsumaniensis TaxID=2910233 RepID=UPI003D0DF698